MTEVDKAQDARLARVVADGGKIRALLLELWQRTRLDWGFVSDRLAQTFRRERSLGSSERRFVAEVIYGLVRHLRRIDAGIAAGSRRTASPRDEQRLLACLVLEHGLPIAHAAKVDRSIDWEKVAGIDRAIAEMKVERRIAIGCSWPDWLAARAVAERDDAEELARGLNARAPMTVRANTLIRSRDELAASIGLRTTPGRWCDTALQIDERVNLYGLDAFKRGAFEAQDEGSQLLASLVEAAPGMVVVDACAGAGGKTLALAAAMQNRGRLVACDIDGSKLEELRRRARRAGVSNAQAVVTDGTTWPEPLDGLRGRCERVLVDAPCSGVGALRRNPEARWRLADADLASFAQRQKAITTRAAELLAPGGRMVYATCTVLDVENRAVVEAVLAARPELSVVAVPAALASKRDPRFFEVTPHTHGTDGFFAAVLEKRP